MGYIKYFLFHMQIHQYLSVNVRCVKAINTTLGRMSFTTAVICKPFFIITVRTALQDCGLQGIELGFVNMGEVDRGKCMH